MQRMECSIKKKFGRDFTKRCNLTAGKKACNFSNLVRFRRKKKRKKGESFSLSASRFLR